jgi:hypothetical protein
MKPGQEANTNSIVFLLRIRSIDSLPQVMWYYWEDLSQFLAGVPAIDKRV